jgi:hypothetical protein
VGEDAHASLDGDRLLDRLDVVEFHHHGRTSPVLAQIAVDRLSNFQIVVERDEVFS